MSEPTTPVTNSSTPGFVSTTTQFVDVSGVVETHVTFDTIDPTSDVQITEDLSAAAVVVYDDTVANAVLDEIKLYAGKIQCSDFHGKGSIDDYNELFVAAAKIANETKQMQLDVDIEGFADFADAAEQLSALFNSFIVKLQNVSIIDDSAFLASVAAALRKIWELSEVFGKFKETILATSSIQIPKSAHDTRVVIETVMGEINCAMKYINHFVDSAVPAPPDADLSTEEQSIIDNAVATIDNWNVLCEQGVSIAMANNPDIQYISQANAELSQKTAALTLATTKLRAKLAAFTQ